MQPFQSIWDDLKQEWQKPNALLTRLIIVNCTLFVFTGLLSLISDWASHPEWYVYFSQWMFLSPSLKTFIIHPWTLLTYSFVHTSFIGMLFNMLYLYWFGQLLGQHYGQMRMISLYIYGGLIGGVFYVLLGVLFPSYLHEMDNAFGLIGSNSAIYAVIVGAATAMPNFRMHLILFGPVKLVYLAIGLVTLSFLSSWGDTAGGTLSYMGGALFGYVFVLLLNAGYDGSRPIITIFNWFETLMYRFKKPTFKTYKRTTDSTYKGKGSSSSDEKDSINGRTPNQELVDAILDKISVSGYENLSQEEKQILFRFSEKKSE